jgi:hypothetical protein
MVNWLSWLGSLALARDFAEFLKLGDRHSFCNGMQTGDAFTDHEANKKTCTTK